MDRFIANFCDQYRNPNNSGQHLNLQCGAYDSTSLSRVHIIRCNCSHPKLQSFTLYLKFFYLHTFRGDLLKCSPYELPICWRKVVPWTPRNGLMGLRGDVSKGDVVSILLRVRDLLQRAAWIGEEKRWAGTWNERVGIWATTEIQLIYKQQTYQKCG